MQQTQKTQSKKRNKHINNPQYINLTPFKEMEKHFKYYQNKQTDYSLVYEPQQYQTVEQYHIAHLPFPKGAILVRNFNDEQKVMKIGTQALNQYCYKPYRTNLDSRNDLYQEEIGHQKQIKQEENEKTEPTEKHLQKGYIFNDKIRWANVGYQYDWTQRKYPSFKTKVPQLIQDLCARANKLYNAIRSTSTNYYPESAIINYYSEKDYMTGHLDDAQIDQVSPIYSFSFGLSCIFLIGGRTKQQKPIAVRLNSGDLLIMSQDSRLTYHGVPRIISNSFIVSKKRQNKQQKSELNTRQNIEQYFRGHRININVRQVYPKEQQTL